MNEKKKALKAAFPHTIPIFTGFIFIGIAYGMLMSSKGYGPLWSALISLFVYAGSSQYMAIAFLTSAFNPIATFFMTLIINARYLFYGISMLDKFKDTGKFKPYLIYGLCDETFSIVYSTNPPKGVNRNYFMLFITILNQAYWVLGSALGGILGSFITFNTKGLDFVLTALFVIIFIDQWKSQEDRKPAITGVLSSILCLVIFGPGNFIIPSMICILLVLSALKNSYNEKEIRTKEEQEWV